MPLTAMETIIIGLKKATIAAVAARAECKVIERKHSHFDSWAAFTPEAKAEWISEGKRAHDAEMVMVQWEQKRRHEMVKNIRRSPRHRSKYYD